MKLFLTAVALTIAAPAFAQSAAPADPHAGHAAPAADHAAHEDCCEKTADGKTMPCCEKMAEGGERMECCEKSAAADPHAGHDMSPE